MNFLETFDKLNSLNESNAPGQKTYKDFLIYLAEFLGYEKPANYKDNWVLHHRDCDHDNNREFKNLVLMNPNHHCSLHIQCYRDSKKDIWDFLTSGSTKNGTKFEYWLIGDQIDARINKKITEDPVDVIIKKGGQV